VRGVKPSPWLVFIASPDLYATVGSQGSDSSSGAALLSELSSLGVAEYSGVVLASLLSNEGLLLVQPLIPIASIAGLETKDNTKKHGDEAEDRDIIETSRIWRAEGRV